MNRHHIHCASGLYGQEGVISGQSMYLSICWCVVADTIFVQKGMRATCDLFVEIDVAKAMSGESKRVY